MKSFCIHGHFYQPPREDPFTGVISPEKGAAPFANFNEKINAECYRPNAELGNFEVLSFNLGPTLAAWLEGHDPPTYHASSSPMCQTPFGLATALPTA